MQEFDWNNNITDREEKQKLAIRIAKRVKNGDVIGFGSGSTSYLAAEEIAKRIKKENLIIKAIPTSSIIEDLCKKLKIETVTLSQAKPDWCFDGADEIDPHNWLIKGMGAALYREKQNMKNSNENYILVDHTKFVKKLGEKHPVPIEVKIGLEEKAKQEIKKIGATKVEIRQSNIEKKPLITDNGNYILYAWFENIDVDLEQKLNKIEGVVENGLFIGYDIIIIE